VGRTLRGCLVDPSIITGQKQSTWISILTTGQATGETLFWQPATELPPYERIATVQFDVDTQKLYDLYVKLMTQPPRVAKIASQDFKPDLRSSVRGFKTRNLSHLVELRVANL